MHREVDVNVHDCWNSTPLYYACLCGHIDVVEMLLRNGARCQANTFDAERCLYGALSDNIRNMLLNWKVATSYSVQRDAYGEFLRRLFESGKHADVVFLVGAAKIHAHRAILVARSVFFAKRFSSGGRWASRPQVNLSSSLMSPESLRHLFFYLYTGCVEISRNEAPDLIRLARHCQLVNLTEALERGCLDIQNWQSSKPNAPTRVTIVSLEPDVRQLAADFGRLADAAFPSELCDTLQREMPFPEARHL